MPKPFIAYTAVEFQTAAKSFPWLSSGKTEVHVHHTWRPNHDQYQGLRSIEGMWNYHVNEKGWSDIAQHVSIAPDGTIWTGRDWNRTPVSALGHNNSGVFMIETIGDFDHGKDLLEGVQLDALLTVVATIQVIFNLPLWWSIKFHNQMSGKTCPGSSVDRNQFIASVGEKRSALEATIFAFSEAELESVDSVRLPPFSTEHLAEHEHDAELEAYFAAEQETISAIIASVSSTSTAEVTSESVVVSESSASVDAALSPNLSRAFMTLENARIAYNVSEQDDDIEHLLAALGRVTSQGIERNFATASLESISDDDGFFSRTGKRILNRVEKQLYDLICGDDPKDEADRLLILGALDISDKAVSTAITAVLMTGFGIGAAAAGIIGMLILKRILRPAIDEAQKSLCEVWAERLAEATE